MSRKKVFFTAIIWRAVQSMGQQGISFVITLVLARLLCPDDFGVFAIVNFFIAISLVFSEGGIGMALVYKEDLDQIDLETALTFNLAIALIFFLLLFFLSPFLADFYGKPMLSPMLRVIGVQIIISSCTVVQYAQLNREMRFRALSISALTASSVAGCIGIIMALCGMGTWSLVIQHLCSATLLAAIYWLAVPWLPRFRFNRGRFKKLFSWGGGVLLSRLIANMSRDCYAMIIGKVYSISDAGLINRAQALEYMPRNNGIAVFCDVASPAAFRCQNDDTQLRKIIGRFLRTTYFVLLPVLCWMLVYAETIIEVLMGAKWCAAAPLLRILCLAGMFMIQNDFVNLAFKAKNRIRQLVAVEFFRRVFFITTACATCWVGLSALLWGGVAVWGIIFLVNAWFAGRLIDFGLRRQLLDSAPVFLLNLFTAAILWTTGGYLRRLPPVGAMIASLLLTFVIYMGTALLFRMKDVTEAWSMVREKFFKPAAAEDA